MPVSDAAARAAKLSRIPGVTVAEAAKRYGLLAADVLEARKVTRQLSLAELALAALTLNGTRDSGDLGDLTAIASRLDSDVATATQVRELLQSLPGMVELKGRRYRLLRPWP